MERVGEHPVPAGPLAVRWVAYELARARAGVTTRARLRLENAGSAPWRSRGREGVQLGVPLARSAREPDRLGRQPGRASTTRPARRGASSWSQGGRAAAPGATASRSTSWRSSATGSRSSDRRRSISPSRSRPRIDERRLAVRVHGDPDTDVAAALAAQDEPIVTDEAVAVAHLVPGAIPAPDWSRLLLDAHEEGYGAVGGAIEAESRADRRRYAAWAPGGGRNPRFGRAAAPPVVAHRRRAGDRRGLPAYAGGDALFEGRAVVRLRSRSGRRSD